MKQSDSFEISKSQKIKSLDFKTLQEKIISPSRLVSHLNKISLPNQYVAQFKQGQFIEWGTSLPPNKPLAVYSNKNLIGIAHYDPRENLLMPHKVL